MPARRAIDSRGVSERLAKGNWTDHRFARPIFTARMPFAADAWIRPAYEYPVETYLADLDRHGIRASFLLLLSEQMLSEQM
jgi:hypothetical protein